jgi:hypothetical protein
VWDDIEAASGLSPDDFEEFVLNCSLDLGCSRPEESDDAIAIHDLLFSTVAGPERIVELKHADVLRELGWTRRYEFRNVHRFPDPQFGYYPIQETAQALRSAIECNSGGYIGVFGAPGSGKSTLLTHTLRELRVKLVRYYAYVPDAQDPSASRGESASFLHDVTLRLKKAGLGPQHRPDPSDRLALAELLYAQLQVLGEEYSRTRHKTVILVDGLDHIARELRPERSLLQDLPQPQAIPGGVYFVVGSQTSELNDLPPQVRAALAEPDRHVTMGRLSRSDVDAMALKVVPALAADQRRQVYDLCDGHPLALVYMLKQLGCTDDVDSIDGLLRAATPYSGDVKAYYSAHWYAIQDNANLVHALGLIARSRRSIPMGRFATWLEPATLAEIRTQFGHYFEEQSRGRWSFFHNSFRLFLEDRTGEPYLGQTREQTDRAFHQELAERCADAPAPWRWESLYHRYKAGDYAGVVALATQEWFREQAEALRPLDAVRTDIRLALRAAGECEDAVALARLTLAGAAQEQRAWSLEDRSLPDLLVKVGEAEVAAEHLRDGNRLRVDPEHALRAARHLLAVPGMGGEARRIFELAQPLGLLSGRTIADDHNRPSNLWDLLGEWARCAVALREPSEVVEVIRRISVEPSRLRRDHDTPEQASRALQGWLLFLGAQQCCESGDWGSWQVMVDSLDDKADLPEKSYVLLRSAQRLHHKGDADASRRLLSELLSLRRGAGPLSAEGHISVAELALSVAGDQKLAQSWVKRTPPIPVEDRGTGRERQAAPHELRYRHARLRYLLGETRGPRALVDEAEASAPYSEHLTDTEKSEWRQIALAVVRTAELWAKGRSGEHLAPATFVREVGWILDLFGRRSTLASVWSSLSISSGRCDVLGYVVDCAAEQGSGTLAALRVDLDTRWTAARESPQWTPILQRGMVIAVAAAGADAVWAKSWLRRIGERMLDGPDPGSRVDACKAQAEAWVALGELGEARAEVRRMATVARGIRSEKDYQLTEWIKWLSRVNEVETDQIEARVSTMLSRLVSVADVGGSVEAAEAFLRMISRWSPARGVRVLEDLLERTMIGHQSGLACFLGRALETQTPLVRDVRHVLSSLMLPLTPDAEPGLLESLIVRTSDVCGRAAAIAAAKDIVNLVKVESLANSRSGWFAGVVDGVGAVGVAPEAVGLQASATDRKARGAGAEADGSLKLTSGERLEQSDVRARAGSVNGLRQMLAQADKEHPSSFDWPAVAAAVATGLADPRRVVAVAAVFDEGLSGWRWGERALSGSLVALSKRLADLGEHAQAWSVGESALRATRSWGWAPGFDSRARRSALENLIGIDATRAHRMATRLYARDLGDEFRYPNQVALGLFENLKLMEKYVPLPEVWREIEIYLDELFASVPVLHRPRLEALLRGDADNAKGDSFEQAIGLLLAAYLDHPSYAVAQGAVRACTAALLDGDGSASHGIETALRGTDQAVERALMSLDAATVLDPELGAAFASQLQDLLSSPNYVIRLVASEVLARLGDKPIDPLRVSRTAPAAYDVHLPCLAGFSTETDAEGEAGAVLLDDPARTLSPFDTEARSIARVASLPPANVMYRAAEILNELQTHRTWFADDRQIDDAQLTVFLRETGLAHSFNKPHISPSRRAIAYVIAELVDGGFLGPETTSLLRSIVLYHDPLFISSSPHRRPRCVVPIRGADADEGSYFRLADNWVDAARESLSNLPSSFDDTWIVVAERTRLKLLQDGWPEETRASVLRMVSPNRMWEGLDVEEGYLPLPRGFRAQASRYLDLRAPLPDLVIAGDLHRYETPGSDWLALNPAVALALNWRPAPDGWFRWVNEEGCPTAESVWWRDGSLTHLSTLLHTEVGSGWLVLVTRRAFDDLEERLRPLSRGGFVRRALGWLGVDGRSQALDILPLPL